MAVGQGLEQWCCPVSRLSASLLQTCAVCCSGVSEDLQHSAGADSVCFALLVCILLHPCACSTHYGFRGHQSCIVVCWCAAHELQHASCYGVLPKAMRFSRLAGMCGFGPAAKHVVCVARTSCL